MSDKPAGDSQNNQAQQVNTAQAVRDILVASLEKGQFITAVIALIFLIVFLAPLWLLGPEDRAKFVFTFVHPSAFWTWGGYGLAVLVAVLWFFQQRRFRRLMEQEMERMAKEKSRMQADAYVERDRVDKLIALLTQNPLWKEQLTQLLEQSARPQRRIVSSTEPPLDQPQDRGLFDNLNLPGS